MLLTPVYTSFLHQVYSDLEVSFVISENQDLLNALAKTSELTCGQTAYTSQFYYGVLLHELLNFQLSDRHNHLQVFMSVGC